MISAIERIYRCIMLAFGRGRITFVDDSGNVQKMQVRFGQLEIIDNLPAPHDYGFTSNPPIGSDAAAIFMGGNRKNGLVVGVGSQEYRMKNLAEGEVAIYDKLGQSVYLTKNGIVINGAGLPLTVNNTPVVTINAETKVQLNTPLLDVVGNIVAGGFIQATEDIIDNYGVNVHNMSQMRTLYNTHEHQVVNVQGGTGTITTSVPTVLE